MAKHVILTKEDVEQKLPKYLAKIVAHAIELGWQVTQGEDTGIITLRSGPTSQTLPRDPRRMSQDSVKALQRRILSEAPDQAAVKAEAATAEGGPTTPGEDAPSAQELPPRPASVRKARAAKPVEDVELPEEPIRKVHEDALRAIALAAISALGETYWSDETVALLREENERLQYALRTIKAALPE